MKKKQLAYDQAVKISDLSTRINCGAGGHKMSVHRDMRSPFFSLPRVSFKCTECDASYEREVDKFTEKEIVLLRAYDMED